MDEAKRFLRYVTPGLVFLTVTLILLWVIEPSVAHRMLKNFTKESGIGLAIATLLASGGIGFMFSVAHHWLHWHCGRAPVDHSRFIASLRARGILRLVDRDSGVVLEDTENPDRFQSWVILVGLWHERLVKGDSIVKSADPRASSLADLVHSVGTARVATVAAWIFTLVVLWRFSDMSMEPWPIARFITGNTLAAGFVKLYSMGYRRTGEAAQRFAEQVLDDALTQERLWMEDPIDTHVAR